jgi:mannose-6-phosphate isomerase-like protein (cupin superfamily)
MPLSSTALATAVVVGDKHSQTARLTLASGATDGGPDNRHKGADQWLYGVSRKGPATVNGERFELRDGTVVLIHRGGEHEIMNIGLSPLKGLIPTCRLRTLRWGDELSAGTC